jgi:uncharacterized membrane protein YraQ (UPF0718 family)
MITNIIYLTLINFLNFLPVLVISIVVAQIINSYISKEAIKKILKEKKGNTIRASGIGLLTPGPLASYLPFLKTLKKRGLPLSMIVAFITSQTLVGPMRLFLEVEYFGITFFVYRVIISFLIAVSVGMIYHFLEEYIEL